MEHFRNCPQCGCDLNKEKRKQKERIEKIIDEEHGEDLKGARLRSKLLHGFSGAVIGFFLGFSISVVIVAALNEFGVYNDALLGFIGLSATALTASYFGYSFAKGATPKEERYLRKKLKSEMLL